MDSTQQALSECTEVPLRWSWSGGGRSDWLSVGASGECACFISELTVRREGSVSHKSTHVWDATQQSL